MLLQPYRRLSRNRFASLSVHTMFICNCEGVGLRRDSISHIASGTKEICLTPLCTNVDAQEWGQRWWRLVLDGQFKSILCGGLKSSLAIAEYSVSRWTLRVLAPPLGCGSKCCPIKKVPFSMPLLASSLVQPQLKEANSTQSDEMGILHDIWCYLRVLPMSMNVASTMVSWEISRSVVG